MTEPGSWTGAFDRPAPGNSGREAADENLVPCLNAMVTACSIYPLGHPKAQETIGTVREILEVVLEASSGLTLMRVEGELVVDGTPWRRASALASSLLAALDRWDIERIVAGAQATPEDLLEILLCLTGDHPPESTAAVEVGRLEALQEGEGDPTLGDFALETYVDRVRVEAERWLSSPDRPIDSLRSALRQMLDAERHSEREHLLHETLGGPADGFWRHATLVALHATQLARQVGLGGDLLHELALGALLHDIGVLVPTVDGTRQPEWKERSESHPMDGMLNMAERTDVPALVLLIVQQHHRHLGPGGFPDSAARVNLASRIVAVADTWVTLINTTATLPGISRLALCRTTLESMAGRELDHDLVDLLLGQSAE